MTGFGRAQLRERGWSLGCQVRSVNHRFLDLQVLLPEGLGDLEGSVRGWVQRAAVRGRVEVRVRAERHGADIPVKVDRALARSLSGAARALGALPGVRAELDAGRLLEFPGLVRVDNSAGFAGQAVRRAVRRCVERSLVSMAAARRTEGRHLVRDLRSRLMKIDRARSRVQKLASRLPDETARRLRRRLAELLQGASINEGRLEQEVAVLASRADISEELVKLGGLVEQARALLASGRGPVGKRLDFLVQEMNREANTIGSKSGTLEITRLTVDMKTEIEKVREQVQNLE
ncbi:MAG: YicC/YloC family endoribonuclease [Acidobacteriota bacterium]